MITCSRPPPNIKLSQIIQDMLICYTPLFPAPLSINKTLFFFFFFWCLFNSKWSCIMLIFCNDLMYPVLKCHQQIKEHCTIVLFNYLQYNDRMCSVLLLFSAFFLIFLHYHWLFKSYLSSLHQNTGEHKL